MRLPRFTRAFGAALILVLGTASAWAQSAPGSDSTYNVTYNTLGSNMEAEPSSGVTSIMAGQDDLATAVTLPFSFPFYGTTYASGSTYYIMTNGFMSFTSSADNYNDYTFPNQNNGVAIYPLVNDYHLQNGSVKYWVTGTSPNRHLTILWQNFRFYSTTTGSGMNTQLQLYETTGSIKTSYSLSTGGSWGNYTGEEIGLQGASSSQWVVPAEWGNVTSNTGMPVHDYSFDKFQVVFTGRAFYDRYIVDQSGIGNSSEQGVPLAGMTVEARTSGGTTVGSALTDSQGNFSLSAVGVPPTQSGSIVVTSAGSACAVRPTPGGSLYAATLFPNVSFAGNAALGAVTLNETNDPGGVQRAPINIARTIQGVYDWSKARAPTKTPQFVDPVLWDSTSSAATSYTAKNGATLASMRIGASTANPDAWDVSVIRKFYGRHVLGAISADPAGAYDTTFDGVSNDQNAFAEAFGYYMNVIVSTVRDQRYYDGTSTTTASILDLENPTLTTSPSSSVAGWVASALFDLTDAANEPWDTFDGTGTAGENVFNAVASMTTAPTSSTFELAWIAKGYNATPLVKDFIHHGLILDDSDEPNDGATESAQLTQFGVIRSNRILNLFNEDWYQFNMPDPTNVLAASIVFDRTKYASVSLTMQVLDLSGNVLATGSPQGSLGPVLAQTGALPAGDYRVRVALASGGPLPNYTLQAFSQLAFKNGTFQPWTLNQPINVPVNVKGGVPPYTLVVLEPFVKPDGLLLDGVNAKVAGQPTGPQPPKPPIPIGGSYTYDFILSAQDSATPPNTASGPVSFTVNDIVRQHFGDFIAFAYNKFTDRRLPVTGGTPGYGLSLDEGALPSGLAFQAGADMRFVGTPGNPGSYYFKTTATDSTGSKDSAASTAVVCSPFGSTGLALGSSACGFYFDALQGATVNLAIKTVKRRPLRLLSVKMLDVDGNTVLPAKVAAGKGKASVSGFVAPSSGRFYCIVASATGDTTLINCTGKNSAPKRGKGNNGTSDIVPGGDAFNLEFGALAGATFTFSGKPDKSGLELKARYLLDPNGNVVPFADGEVNEKGGGVSFSKVLPTTGTWRLSVVAKPGAQGKFTYSYKLKQPAGVFVAD